MIQKDDVVRVMSGQFAGRQGQVINLMKARVGTQATVMPLDGGKTFTVDSDNLVKVVLHAIPG